MSITSHAAAQAGFLEATPRELYDAVEKKYVPRFAAERRQASRRPLWTPIRLWARDIDTTTDGVTLDVSPCGLSVLCKQYVTPGSRVVIGFKKLDTRLAVEGVVRHCLYLDGDYHCTGIEFDVPSGASLS